MSNKYNEFRKKHIQRRNLDRQLSPRSSDMSQGSINIPNPLHRITSSTDINPNKLKSRPGIIPKNGPIVETKFITMHNLIEEANRTYGRWTYDDDLSLIMGMREWNDLRCVHRLGKFSRNFSFEELRARWYALLYESKTSYMTPVPRNFSTTQWTIEDYNKNLLIKSMRRRFDFMDKMWDIYEREESKSRHAKPNKFLPFNVKEEDILCQVKSTDEPHLDDFEEILKKNEKSFQEHRTPEQLYSHWTLLKHYCLLNDQINKREKKDIDEPQDSALLFNVKRHVTFQKPVNSIKNKPNIDTTSKGRVADMNWSSTTTNVSLDTKTLHNTRPDFHATDRNYLRAEQRKRNSGYSLSS